MNYNQINRSSLINCIYSDRPGYPYNQTNQVWKNNNQQHLNPSKSKVNVRQSLNKTTQNYSSVNPTISTIRNSCLLNTSMTTHNPPKDVFQEDKYFKASKQNQQPHYNSLSKDNYPRYSQTSTPMSFEQRKKSESAHLRTSSTNDFIFKLQNDFKILEFDKSQKGEKIQKTQNTDYLRDLIMALTKRVSTSEEEISNLKIKVEKEKKIQGIQNELSQYKNKMFELVKFNSKNFNEIEMKIQQNQQTVSQLRQKIFSNQSSEDFSKKANLLEAKISEIYENLKIRDQNFQKKMLKNLENLSKKLIGDEICNIKIGLDSSKKQFVEINNKIKRLQVEMNDKLLGQEYKKSNRKSLNSCIVQVKQSISVKDGQLNKDRSKQITYPQSRNFFDQPQKSNDNSRKEIDQPKRQLIIKQKIYYIDNSGFLLDENKYYLLNNKNQQIILPDYLINSLKENNMLSLGIKR